MTGTDQQSASLDIARAAVSHIPPLWPLDSSVAVNPFLGQTHLDLATTSARLARVAGLAATMPRAWYQARIDSGVISEEDLAAALAASPATDRPANVEVLKAAVAASPPEPRALPTIADLCAETSATDWPAFVAERFGAWAAGHLDKGQALWAAPRGRGAYAAWRAFASRDLTPEIIGLKGFAAHVSHAPETPEEALDRAVRRLGVPDAALDTYFHQLLMTLGGWSQSARHRLWQAELYGGSDNTARDFLVIRLLWEEALYDQYSTDIAPRWEATLARHATPVRPDSESVIDCILQDALERASQRSLARQLQQHPATAPADRPAVQAAFCIDVRSEVFRRALETVDPTLQTIGFAGFFGIATLHRRFASDEPELHLPVLLRPDVTTCATAPDAADADLSARFKARAVRAWNRFKLAAVSSFAFVEANGPVYIGKLVRESLGLKASASPSDPPPRFDPALDDGQRADTAEKILRAMSLTRDFARLVLLTGHGASVVNNAHASALHCGACGGYSGEVNARLLAQLLNDPTVRQELATRGIVIPRDTLFLGALHDTTTDVVTVYSSDHPSASHAEDLERVTDWLAQAGAMARTERALRLPGAGRGNQVMTRSRDWAEVRPEWALAGCRAFIAAPRARTVGGDLEGRAFLHDYDWRKDEGFGVLELIMTAPVVVASWISLQYYGSSVAPAAFGGGNKLLHNVVGGMGVFEGNGGLLRPGLPWQSVHDGQELVHEPLRLTVCIEAPTEALTTVLRNHEGVRALFDNRWLHLFALDEQGNMAWRYAGGLKWQEYPDATES